MKTAIKNIFVGALFLVLASSSFAYPPDNAAVLYYKAFMLMKEPNETDANLLGQLRKGEIGINEQIQFCVESNHRAIKEIVSVAQIKNCDWGLDYSEGLATLLPHLGKIRSCAKLLAADGAVIAEKGDYKKAIERWLALFEMNRHMGEDIIVERLVGTACGGIALDYIERVMPKISDDCQMLEWLRWRLADISTRCPSMRTTIGNDAAVWSNNLNREGLLEILDNSGLSLEGQKKAKQILLLRDNNDFYVTVVEYYQRIISRMQIAYDLPYSEAGKALEDLSNEVKKDTVEKPEAVMTDVLLPATSRVLTIDTRFKTHLNAVLAAIEIYIIKTKTGKLPDELPTGLPKDLFSGKDFLYEKTDTCFTLTGQGKDLDKDIIQKYEFKVTK